MKEGALTFGGRSLGGSGGGGSGGCSAGAGAEVMEAQRKGIKERMGEGGEWTGFF